MAQMTYMEALRDGMRMEMRRDGNVFLAGEDVGFFGGCFGQTAGLFDEFGKERVVDTPITETAILGLGVGAAATVRPVVLKLALPLAGWVGAVGLHFVHNLLVTFLLAEGLGFVAKLLLFWFFDLLFFVLVVALVARDRAIVRTGLAEEIGRLLDQPELERTTSWWMLVPLWNFFSLSQSRSGYAPSRRKQLDLVELAFLKHRRARGEAGLEPAEQALRQRIWDARRAGVVLG